MKRISFLLGALATIASCIALTTSTSTHSHQKGDLNQIPPGYRDW